MSEKNKEIAKKALLENLIKLNSEFAPQADIDEVLKKLKELGMPEEKIPKIVINQTMDQLLQKIKSVKLEK